MNKHLLAGVSTLALLLGAASAQAADLGRPITKAPAMVAAPVYSGWTGFYIGGQVGYQYGYFRETDFFSGTNLATGFAGGRFNPDGVVGGGHVGFNLQTGAFVWGIEGDIEGSGVRGTLNYGGGNGVRFDQRWQSSIRGRLGFTVGNTAMIYATGGAAFSDLRYNYFTNTQTELFTGNQTGYTVGAGIEWMFAPAWSARVEYRYTDFGRFNDQLTIIGGPRNANISARQEAEFSTVRVGISYHFGGMGGGAPVVAAY